MKLVHRIGLRATASQRNTLESLGVKLPAGIALPGDSEPLLAFDLDEDHPGWADIAPLLEKWRASDMTRTVFSKAELQTARWFKLGAWHHGYPQPDEDVFGYRQATYDLADWCEQCGIGMKQKAPFQMKREPKWGKNSVLQLIWVYDEVFVTPQLWSEVFNPHGIASRAVLNTKGGELKTVVQLVVDDTVDIVTTSLPSERCAKCRRVKYLHVTRGGFPTLVGVPPAAMVKTRQYFGSDHQADACLLVAKPIADAFISERFRGAALRPVQSGDDEPGPLLPADQRASLK